jgi:pimeloyl-ACP methyl ester carboxylesterase
MKISAATLAVATLVLGTGAACAGSSSDAAFIAQADIVLAPCSFATAGALWGNLRRGMLGTGQALCGRYEVWENRAAGAGRKIALNVIVLKATGEDPAPDPLFLFAGGPGEAVSQWGWVPVEFAEIREHRDIVLVDQRGTGLSHPLACDPLGEGDDLQGFLNPMLDAGYVVNCRTKLEERADLRHYTTADHAEDIDEIRAALGYERINLWGASYGTRPVLVYLRRHPDHVRAAAIHGVAHTAWKYPLHHASSGQRALDMLFEACRGDRRCAAAFGDPADDLARVMELFSGGPVKTEVRRPEGRGTVPVEVYREVIAERLRSLMYSSLNAVRIPAILQRAAESGSLSELARLELDYQRGFQEGLNWFTGMWLSVTCTEDIPLITDVDIEAETAGTIFGDYRVRTHRAACELWPEGVVPEGFSDPVRSEAPVLITSGDLDPVTPPVAGATAAEHLPNSRHIVVRQGHGQTDMGCYLRVLTDFFESGTTVAVDVSCLEAVDLPAWDLGR